MSGLEYELRLVVRLALVAAALWVLSRLRTTFGVLFVSTILAILLDPAAEWVANRTGGHRGVAAALVVGAPLVGLVAVARWLAGPLGRETARLLAAIPGALQLATEQLARMESEWLALPPELSLTRALQGFTLSMVERVLSASIVVGAHAYGILLTPLLAFFLLKDGPRLGRSLLAWLPPNRRELVSRAVRVGTWALRRAMLGTLVIAAVSWMLLWVGLWRLRMPNALGWSAVVAAAETVPYLGPLFAVVTLGSAAFAQGTHLGATVVLLLLAVRGFVDVLVAPLVLGSLLRVHAVLVIASILAGAELFGILGVLVAAPIASALATLARSVRSDVA
ncbi:MAG: hypothetical protein C4304_06600 [candidate division GAL15 bacterium]